MSPSESFTRCSRPDRANNETLGRARVVGSAGEAVDMVAVAIALNERQWHEERCSVLGTSAPLRQRNE